MNAEQIMQAGDGIILDVSKMSDLEIKKLEYGKRVAARRNREQSQAKFEAIERLLRNQILHSSMIDEIAQRACARLAAFDQEPTAVVQAIWHQNEEALSSEHPAQAERLHRMKAHVADAIELLRAYNDGTMLIHLNEKPHS